MELIGLLHSGTGMGGGAADTGNVSDFWKDENNSQIDGNLFTC